MPLKELGYLGMGIKTPLEMFNCPVLIPNYLTMPVAGIERKPAVGYNLIDTELLSPRFPRPVTVEPMDQLDDEEGLPEKLVIKNQQFHKYVVLIDSLLGACLFLRKLVKGCVKEAGLSCSYSLATIVLALRRNAVLGWGGILDTVLIIQEPCLQGARAATQICTAWLL